jgi:hypothetical protein
MAIYWEYMAILDQRARQRGQRGMRLFAKSRRDQQLNYSLGAGIAKPVPRVAPSIPPREVCRQRLATGPEYAGSA